MLDLKAGLFCAEEERDDVDVFVGARADRAFRWRVFLWRIMEQTEDGVAHLDPVFEPEFIKAEMQRDGAQEIAAHFVQCIKECPGGAVKIIDFSYGWRVRHRLAIRRTVRQKAACVPEFL